MSRANSAGALTRSYKVLSPTRLYLLRTLRHVQNAIDILNQRRRPARPTSKPTAIYAGLNQMQGVKGRSDMRGTPSIVGMKQWLQQLGHSTGEVDKLNIIHVAGTKGKGSTCAFIDALLQSHAQRSGYPRKRGLYTSPHLLVPEERIRINMPPLDRSMFAKYFFEVFDILSKQDEGPAKAEPRFLQLFFLLAIHTFLREGVDTAIIETHYGGEYDATNVIEHPVITAVTSLGLDHVSQLGPSIEETHVAEVLKDRAMAKGVELTFVDLYSSLPREEVKLQLDIQRLNCSLALAITRSFVSQKDPNNHTIHPDDVLEAIKRFSWPGRFQIIAEHNNTWYLDGAHNEMSVEIAAKWFADASRAQRQMFLVERKITLANEQSRQNLQPRVLIFGQVSKQRDPTEVIRNLAASFQPGDIQVVVFTLYDPVQDFEAATDGTSSSSDPQSLEQFSSVWSAKHPNTKILFATDVPQALTLAKEQANVNDGVQALITGSQHLVGAALFALGNRAWYCLAARARHCMSVVAVRVRVLETIALRD